MSVRQYFIDWLRIILILSVFLYHVGMIFSDMHWHIKNDVQISFMQPLLAFLHVWRIPLLFLVSGVSSFYALGSRTPKMFLRERFKRLIIPFVFGLIILVPVQVYLEKIAQYDSIFIFYTEFFHGIYPKGNFTWSHLWFIFYLFVFALLISPFLTYIRSKKFKRLQEKLINVCEAKLGINVLLIPLLSTQILVYPFLPGGSHYTYDVLFFLFGICIFSNRRIVTAIQKQRRLYFNQSGFFAVILMAPHLFDFGKYDHMTQYFASVILALSCSMTALGYAKQYLNKDSKFRKVANEAIYPFYLLQQPVIVIIAFFIVKLQLPVMAKLFTITIIAFGVSVAIYWFLVRPFNAMRIFFGMKPIQVKTPQPFPIVLFNILYPPKQHLNLNMQLKRIA